MPISKIDTVGDGRARLALWQMTEPLETLPRPEGIDLSAFHSQQRLREKLTTYMLLEQMTGLKGLQIRHNPMGQPILDNWNISISHTRGWLAMILSQEVQVAVDVEYQSDRINRIASHFIRPDESPDDQLSRLIDWCAKETAYKYFSDEDLQYFEMRLRPFAPGSNGLVMVEDLKEGHVLPVHYVSNDDYVLTWAAGMQPMRS